MWGEVHTSGVRNVVSGSSERRAETAGRVISSLHKRGKWGKQGEQVPAARESKGPSMPLPSLYLSSNSALSF